MLPYLKVFFFGFIIDIFYVVWIKSVAIGNVFLAGVSAVALAAPSLFGYLEIVDNRKMVYPYLFGLFCGTIFATVLFT